MPELIELIIKFFESVIGFTIQILLENIVAAKFIFFQLIYHGQDCINTITTVVEIGSL